jgi:hypothetical protein
MNTALSGFAVGLRLTRPIRSTWHSPSGSPPPLPCLRDQRLGRGLGRAGGRVRRLWWLTGHVDRLHWNVHQRPPVVVECHRWHDGDTHRNRNGMRRDTAVRLVGGADGQRQPRHLDAPVAVQHDDDLLLELKHLRLGKIRDQRLGRGLRRAGGRVRCVLRLPDHPDRLQGRGDQRQSVAGGSAGLHECHLHRQRQRLPGTPQYNWWVAPMVNGGASAWTRLTKQHDGDLRLEHEQVRLGQVHHRRLGRGLWCGIRRPSTPQLAYTNALQYRIVARSLSSPAFGVLAISTSSAAPASHR